MNKKVFIIFFILTCMFITLFQTISIADSSFLKPDIIQPNDKGGVVGKTQNIAGTILGIVQVVGVAVAIIMLIMLAIKYMSSAPNDRAEIKKHAVVYVVGAVVLFASAGILEIIKGFAETIGESDTSSGYSQDKDQKEDKRK